MYNPFAYIYDCVLCMNTCVYTYIDAYTHAPYTLVLFIHSATPHTEAFFDVTKARYRKDMIAQNVWIPHCACQHPL